VGRVDLQTNPVCSLSHGESFQSEFEIDPDFQGRGRVEVEGQIFRVDESEIEGRRSKVEVEGRNIFEIIFKFLKNFDF